MRESRLFSAACWLDPLAVAPARFGTEAVYSPPDSSTLPKYGVPPTVVEKPLTISSAVLLLAAEADAPPPCAPPPDATLVGALELLEAGVDALELDDPLADVVAGAAPADAPGEGFANTTGFNTVIVEVTGKKPPIIISLPSWSKSIFPNSFIGRLAFSLSRSLLQGRFLISAVSPTFPKQGRRISIFQQTPGRRVDRLCRCLSRRRKQGHSCP
jgi:hypothetical protein